MGHYFTNENLPSDIRENNCNVLGNNFTFLTDNGVFSKDGLDFGSRLLLEVVPLEEVGGKILDMGCGYGVLGIVLAKVLSAKVDMVDVNLRALHLSKRNAKLNGVSNFVTIFESNCYRNVSEKYSTIITNPPIRAGKKIVYDIVMNARDHLEDGGNLFLVIRKEQGAKSLIVDLEKVYNVKVLEKSYPLAKGVIESLIYKNRVMSHQIKNTSNSITVDKQIALKLHKLAQDFGVITDKGIEINFDLSITYLSEVLGAKRETVSRQVKVLSELGLITVVRKRFTIHDPNKLLNYFNEK